MSLSVSFGIHDLHHSKEDLTDFSFVAGLNYVAAYNMSMVQSTDVKDAMLAGLTKKKPTFAKL